MYKPGQLFTIDGKIFRVRKRFQKPLSNLNICRECAIENHSWCIFADNGFNVRFGIRCKNITPEGYYPQYIKDNPLCVK
jgi:hypothetical protein